MKIARLTSLNLLDKRRINSLTRRLTNLEEKVLNFDIRALEAIYRVKINKESYKKYKLG